MAPWHWKYVSVEYLPKLSNEESNQQHSITNFSSNEDFLKAAIWRYTSKQKVLKQKSQKL